MVIYFTFKKQLQLISDSQFGFLPECSTTTALATVNGQQCVRVGDSLSPPQFMSPLVFNTWTSFIH